MKQNYHSQCLRIIGHQGDLKALKETQTNKDFASFESGFIKTNIKNT